MWKARYVALHVMTASVGSKMRIWLITHACLFSVALISCGMRRNFLMFTRGLGPIRRRRSGSEERRRLRSRERLFA